MRAGLYRKLEGLTKQRQQLRTELRKLSTRPEKDAQAEVDQAIDALRHLGEALKAAKPEDTKELLSSIVTKIALFYDHTATKSGRWRNRFTYGVVYLRPDAKQQLEPDPKTTLMRRCA